MSQGTHSRSSHDKMKKAKHDCRGTDHSWWWQSLQGEENRFAHSVALQMLGLTPIFQDWQDDLICTTPLFFQWALETTLSSNNLSVWLCYNYAGSTSVLVAALGLHIEGAIVYLHLDSTGHKRKYALPCPFSSSLCPQLVSPSAQIPFAVESIMEGPVTSEGKGAEKAVGPYLYEKVRSTHKCPSLALAHNPWHRQF